MPTSNLRVSPTGAQATQSPYGVNPFGTGPYGSWLDQMFRMKMAMAQEQLRQMQYQGQLAGWGAQLQHAGVQQDLANAQFQNEMARWQAQQQAKQQAQQMQYQKMSMAPSIDDRMARSQTMAEALKNFQFFGGVRHTPGGAQQLGNYIWAISPERAHEGMLQYGRNMAQILSGGGSTPAQASVINQAMGQGMNPFVGGAYAPGGMGAYRFHPTQYTPPEQKKGTLPGTIPRTGPYTLHKGEVVIPAPQVNRSLIAALTWDAKQKGVPLGQGKKSFGCGTLGKYQPGSLGEPGAMGTDLLAFQKLRQGTVGGMQPMIPGLEGTAGTKSAWPAYLEQLGSPAPTTPTQIELPFHQAASELDSLALKNPTERTIIEKAKNLLAKGKWSEFDDMVRKLPKGGKWAVLGASIAAVGAGLWAYNTRKNAAEPDAPKTPEEKDTVMGDLKKAAKEVTRAYTGYPVQPEDVPLGGAQMGAMEHMLRRLGVYQHAADVPLPEEGLPPMSAGQFATERLTGKPAPSREVQRAQLAIGEETPPEDLLTMGEPAPPPPPPAQAPFGLQQALSQVQGATPGKPYQGMFGTGTRPQMAPEGTITMVGQLSPREQAFRELSGIPEQREEQHKATMARASATNIYTTLMTDGHRLSPQAYASLKQEADRQTAIASKFEGFVRDRQKALEKELGAGADLEAAIAKIRATQAAMQDRQVTLEELKAKNRAEITTLRQSAETLKLLRLQATSGTRAERQRANDAISGILMEIALATGRDDVTKDEIQQVTAELISLPPDQFEAALEGIKAKLEAFVQGK